MGRHIHDNLVSDLGSAHANKFAFFDNEIGAYGALVRRKCLFREIDLI